MQNKLNNDAMINNQTFFKRNTNKLINNKNNIEKIETDENLTSNNIALTEYENKEYKENDFL
jgi:hypothetical protein